MRKVLIIATCLAAVTSPVTAQIQNGCNVEVEQLINQAGIVATQNAYQQMQLQDIPTTSDLSCIDAIMDFSFDVLISIPNIADLLSDAIQQGCNAVQQRVDNVNDQLNFDYNLNPVPGLGQFDAQGFNFGGNNQSIVDLANPIPGINFNNNQFDSRILPQRRNAVQEIFN